MSDTKPEEVKPEEASSGEAEAKPKEAAVEAKEAETTPEEAETTPEEAETKPEEAEVEPKEAEAKPEETEASEKVEEENTISEQKTTTQDPEKGEPAKKEKVSLSKRLASAQKSAPNPFVFLKNVFIIFLHTIGFLIFLGLFLALPIAMIVIGSLNLRNCPAQRYIPIWLIVSGAVFAFMLLVFISKAIKNKNEKKSPEEQGCSGSYSGFNFILTIFKFAWFIVGNVWVFGVFQPDHINSASPIYCDGATYYMSFVLIILGYVWLVLSCCCSGCLAICALNSEKATKKFSSSIRRRKPEDENEKTDVAEKPSA